MQVSILIPSRGRPHLLNRAIESVLARAGNLEDIEIVIRADHDDETMRDWNSYGLASVIYGPRGAGYHDMATYWNELAAKAEGKWLFCFNDDALIETDDWDLLLDPFDHYGACVAPHDNSTPNDWPAFPFIHRSIYEKLGHLTLFAGLDSWMVRVHECGNRKIDRIPMWVRHIREELRDTTWAESKAAAAELCIDYDVTRRDYWMDLARQDAKLLWGPHEG